ncbi:MAG: type II toxin-antitoxin system VapC family toxin [Sporichthyaceae bacterium]
MSETVYLVDSSVAVPLLSGDHRNHQAARTAVGTRRLGLAGHAAFETYSVLTRLPAPWRRSPEITLLLMQRALPATVHLSGERAGSLLIDLARAQLAGGATFDALVGAAAVEHGSTLITADRRAAGTYAALGVDVELVTF